MHRIVSSESILQEARARLDILQHTQLGQTAMTEEAEVMKVLESLVDDNEILKRDNLQLQSLLAESREDLHTLQEEVDEQRANPPSRAGGRSLLYNYNNMVDVFSYSQRRHSSLETLFTNSWAPIITYRRNLGGLLTSYVNGVYLAVLRTDFQQTTSCKFG
jgi:regulator of replication initiation timing